MATIRLHDATYSMFTNALFRQMPDLLRENIRPLSIADLMRVRLESVGKNCEAFFWDNYFNTIDAILINSAGHPDQIKIQLDSRFLLDLDEESNVKNGALLLAQEEYDAATGMAFKKGQFQASQRLTRQEITQHPVWIQLARGDIGLLEEYAIAVQKKTGFEKIMGVYSIPYGIDTPHLRTFGMRSAEVLSDVVCRTSLDQNSNIVGKHQES